MTEHPDARRIRYARAIAEDSKAPMTGTADAVMAVADAELDELRKRPVVTTSHISAIHASLVEQTGRGMDPSIVRRAVEDAGLAWDFHEALVKK